MENIIHLDGQNSQPGGGRRDSFREVTLSNCKPECNLERQRLSRNSKTDESPLPEAALDSALPSDSDHNFDHHSSEEELEVINCASVIHRERTCQYPEKRKWSQANRLSLGENSCSSDDELRDLMCISTPVEFCSSPPANVHKPSHSQSPPPKVFHSSAANIPPHELCSVSPRKRHRHTPTVSSGANIQRPCLDFEKMQQIRVRLLWRCHAPVCGRSSRLLPQVLPPEDCYYARCHWKMSEETLFQFVVQWSLWCRHSRERVHIQPLRCTMIILEDIFYF